MATYDDLSLRVRLFMKGYPFKRFRIDPVPAAPLKKPLAEARIALVTSAGLHTETQPAFDQGISMGDYSFREISNDVDVQTLHESHNSSSFDHAGVEADKNLTLPIDRLRELVAARKIGSVNSRHFSFMGSILNPRGLISDTATQVARALREDRVDAVLLTPV